MNIHDLTFGNKSQVLQVGVELVMTGDYDVWIPSRSLRSGRGILISRKGVDGAFECHLPLTEGCIIIQESLMMHQSSDEIVLFNGITSMVRANVFYDHFNKNSLIRLLDTFSKIKIECNTSRFKNIHEYLIQSERIGRSIQLIDECAIKFETFTRRVF